MWKKVLIIIVVLAILGVAIYFIVKAVNRSKEQAEIQKLQKISEEAGKDKFDLDGKVISVNAAGNSFVVNIANCSNTIDSHKGKDTTLTLNEKARILKGGQEVKLADIKAGDQVSIQGSFTGDNLSGEMVTVK